MFFACECFNQYTYGQHVTAQSDHKPLEYILNKPRSEAPPRIQRLLIRLQKYQDENLNEDCNVIVHTLVQNLPISTDRLKQLQHDTKLNPVLSKITNYITHGWSHNKQMICHEKKQYWTIRNTLHSA